MPRPTRVLVVGPRRGLLRALATAGVPHVVWSDRPRAYRSAVAIHVAPFDIGQEKTKREVDNLTVLGPFTHVIAGTEASVMPAAIARRAFGARTFARTTVLRCHDKLAMKRHLVKRDIPMTAFVDGNGDTPAKEIAKRLGLPVVSKPRRSSGGRDIEWVESAETLEGADRRGRIFERYVDAPEVSVESYVGNGEIQFQNITEYAKKSHINIVPAGIDDDARAAVLDLNRRVIGALNIHWGITHLEAYLTPNGLLFGEIALRPPGGYIMALLKLAYGFDAWRAFVAMELDLPFEFTSQPRAHTAAVVLHPGVGTVTAVEGVDEIRSLPEVTKAHVRVRPGDLIAQRVGIGSDVGHIILKAPSRAALQTALATIDERMRIDVTPDVS